MNPFGTKGGLTPHARNIHDLEKDEVFEKMTEKEQEKNEWKIVGGIATIFLALIGLGSIK